MAHILGCQCISHCAIFALDEYGWPWRDHNCHSVLGAKGPNVIINLLSLRIVPLCETECVGVLCVVVGSDAVVAVAQLESSCERMTGHDASIQEENV